MITSSIEQLFNRFQQGFKNFDLTMVKNCYHLPCTLNTPDKMTLISNDAELADEINRIFEQLTDEHFTSGKLTNTSYMQLSDEIVFVCIDWKFIDKAEQVFAEFSAFYHLLSIGNEKDKQLKIINATSHQISNSRSLATPFILNE